jgi:hypothetical protein
MRNLIFSIDKIWLLDLSSCHISPKLLFHVESFTTLDEVWTKLEVLFGKKDDREECMLENAKTNPIENP